MKTKKILSLLLIAVMILLTASCTTKVVVQVPGEYFDSFSSLIGGSVPVNGNNTQTPENTTAAPVDNTTQAPVDNTTSAPVENTTSAPVENTTQAPVENTTQAPVVNTTQAPVENTTQAPVENTTKAPEPTTKAPEPTTSAPTSGMPTGTAAIVEYYNTAANKIKTNAASVTRNFEDNQHNAEKLVVPSMLKSTGEKLIGTFLKRNDTPETYTGTADIVAKFPIPGENYVSKLTAADVKSAECKDNGNEYEITIVAKTEKNPTYGQGVSAGFEVISTDAVMDAAGFIVKSFDTEYYDCTVKCKVNKATGNITWIQITTPVVMDVSTSIGINATVGMTFIKDYTVTY